MSIHTDIQSDILTLSLGIEGAGIIILCDLFVSSSEVIEMNGRKVFQVHGHRMITERSITRDICHQMMAVSKAEEFP